MVKQNRDQAINYPLVDGIGVTTGDGSSSTGSSAMTRALGAAIDPAASSLHKILPGLSPDLPGIPLALRDVPGERLGNGREHGWSAG